MLDLTKPLRTRSGVPARVVATDVMDREGRSLLVLLHKHDTEVTYRLYPGGTFHPPGHGANDLDLVNVPQKHTRWFNVYHHEAVQTAAYGYESRMMADDEAGPNRIACVKIEYDEGEGLYQCSKSP